MAEEKKQQSSHDDEWRVSNTKEKRRPVTRFSFTRTGNMVLGKEDQDLRERDWSQIK